MRAERPFRPVAALDRSGGWMRLIRFSLVGAATSILYVLVVAGLVEFGGTPPTCASGLAYAGLIPLNFLAHKFATYRSPGRAIPEARRYLFMHAITLFISMISMYTITDVFNAEHWIGSAVIVVLSPAVSFLMMGSWVFKRSRTV